MTIPVSATLSISFFEPPAALLAWFYSITHNYIIAISLIAFVVMLVTAPLVLKSTKGMLEMQKLQPELRKLQQQHRGDRQKLNEEMMKFYKENNVNPAASCLPLVAQMPVFFSLYLVLKHFGRHIQSGADLSWLHIVPSITDKANAHWSGYLLLGIYAASQVLSSWFMSGQMEKAQRYVMMVVPLIFITVIANFPTGLVLYWVTTNLWTVGQGVVTRRLVPKTAAPAAPTKPSGKSRTPAGTVPAPAAAPQKQQRTTPPPGRRRVKRQGGGRRG